MKTVHLNNGTFPDKDELKKNLESDMEELETRLKEVEENLTKYVDMTFLKVSDDTLKLFIL